MGNGDGISKGTIPHEQRVSNRSIINIYVEGQSEMVVFFFFFLARKGDFYYAEQILTTERVSFFMMDF